MSCNPVTFAEDAKRLAKGALDQVGVYDMFPGTSHVETIGNFVRSSGAGFDGAMAALMKIRFRKERFS